MHRLRNLQWRFAAVLIAAAALAAILIGASQVGGSETSGPVATKQRARTR